MEVVCTLTLVCRIWEHGRQNPPKPSVLLLLKPKWGGQLLILKYSFCKKETFQRHRQLCSQGAGATWQNQDPMKVPVVILVLATLTLIKQFHQNQNQKN